MKKRAFLTVIFIAALALLISSCGSGGNSGSVSSAPSAAATTAATQAQTTAEQKTTAEEKSPAKQPLKLKVAFVISGNLSEFVGNPNDIVTDYVKERFNIEVADIITVPDGQPFEQALGAWIAAKNLPDIFFGNSSHMITLSQNNVIMPIDPYVDKMPDLFQYFEPQYHNMYSYDKKFMGIPYLYMDPNMPLIKGDPYTDPMRGWSLWVREDMLAMAGYKFKTIDELEKLAAETGTPPPDAYYELDPPVNSTEDFYNMLKKFAALDYNVNGLPLIPLSITSWQQFHLGSMFDFGHWTLHDDGSIGGFMGSNGAKDYYKFLKRLYDEKLIDNDFLIQQGEQLQQKYASGRVAVGMQIDDLWGGLDSIRQVLNDNNINIRYIKWPKNSPGLGYFDIYSPGIFMFMINKDMAKENIDRLVEYWNWWYTDEGFEISSWGPESAGIWEIKGGKKLFKDDVVKEDKEDSIIDEKYYGLGRFGKAYSTSPTSVNYNPKSYIRNYPYKIDIRAWNAAWASINGFCTTGMASYGDNGENTTAAGGYFWEFQGSTNIVKLMEAKSSEEFDKVWEDVMELNRTKGKYNEAVADMAEWFKQYNIVPHK